ncbi:kinase-like domain-containing protein [Collybia nuda]|uniref:Kinase-like domain-containing protein n=1 Tax=Collybia nuda TaxID=64659 RepID=A0A9P5Y2V3_9AGAR|nr:kinase-like domain-containing protein [Collybia nuda]
MEAENDIMATDDFDDSQETQEQTQSTQQASQQPGTTIDSHLWGYLQPCSASLTRIDFWKIHPRYTIGRNTEHNQVVLPGFKVSNSHCTITWDGSDEQGSSVIVLDLSSNGTFINGARIGKNQTRILREGNEIAFGTSVPQPHNNGLEDYRFVYRHTAAGPPTTGLYAYYDLSSELGKGSFATVMKAISRKDGKWYAVKIIQESRHVRSAGEPQHPPNTTRSTAFAREISIMETLDHPNICKLKEVFYQDNNDINLVLELVEGGDLLDYILRNNGLSEADAQHITYQICEALAYIHSKGVAHRDLKPENVLLTTDKPPVVKVADFGLAKVVDSLTMLRTMCGTPSYLAPEVVRQDNPDGYDNLVDSWSVGVIVFSMLTNASPFIEDEAQRDVRTRILERRIDWSCLTSANISLPAQAFIRRLLEEDPRRRMTLTDARDHPWLQSYTPVYDHSTSGSITSIPTNDFSMLSSLPEGEGSFQSAVNQDFENMQLQASTSAHPQVVDSGPIPGVLPNNAVRSEGSRAPLQRRSHLMSQAAEDGKPIVEPSWEMVAAAASQEQPTAGPSNPPAKGQNKRVHSELTPLPEEGSMDSAINGSSSLGDPSSTSHKKGRSSDEDDPPTKEVGGSGKMARGKGKALVGVVSPAKARFVRDRSSDPSDDEVVQPRRSGRHPQKVARRV